MATAKSLVRSAMDIFRPVTATTMVERHVIHTPDSGKSNEVKTDQAPKPMDELAAMLHNDPNAKPAVNQLTTPLFTTDPKAIAAAAKKMDFVSGIPADLLAKAMSGQDPQSFLQVLNMVGQTTLATASQLTAATVEQGVSRNNDRMLAELPNQVKQATLNSMVPENATLQHPAAQPLLHLVRSQIQNKNPDMSAQQINAEAERALTMFASELAAPVTATPNTGAQEGGTNWEKWAGISS